MVKPYIEAQQMKRGKYSLNRRKGQTLVIMHISRIAPDERHKGTKTLSCLCAFVVKGIS